jgi:hypothetical protein
MCGRTWSLAVVGFFGAALFSISNFNAPVEAQEDDQKPGVSGTLPHAPGTLHGGRPRPTRWEVPAPPLPHKPLVPPDKPIVGTVQPSAYLPGAGSVRPTRSPSRSPQAGPGCSRTLPYRTRAGRAMVLWV